MTVFDSLARILRSYISNKYRRLCFTVCVMSVMCLLFPVVYDNNKYMDYAVGKCHIFVSVY